MKNLLSVILLLWTMALSAQTSEELLQLVDSAYAEAMSGRLPEAIRINEKGLALVPSDSVGLQCEFYSCLLYCYHRLGDYEQALHYGELCLSYDEAQGDKSNLSASLGNLAGIYSSAGKHDVAISYLNRAIRIEEELLKEDPEHTEKSLAIRKAMLGETLVAKAQTLPESERPPLLTQALQLTKEAYLIWECDSRSWATSTCISATQSRPASATNKLWLLHKKPATAPPKSSLCCNLNVTAKPLTLPALWA